MSLITCRKKYKYNQKAQVLGSPRSTSSSLLNNDRTPFTRNSKPSLNSPHRKLTIIIQQVQLMPCNTSSHKIKSHALIYSPALWITSSCGNPLSADKLQKAKERNSVEPVHLTQTHTFSDCGLLVTFHISGGFFLAQRLLSTTSTN